MEKKVELELQDAKSIEFVLYDIAGLLKSGAGQVVLSYNPVYLEELGIKITEAIKKG